MKKRILKLSVVPLLLAALVVVGGLLSPAEHVVSRSVTLRSDAGAVYSVVAGVGSHATWWKSLSRVERLPDRDGRPCWRQTTSMGEVTFVVLEAEPPRRFVTRIADEDLPFGGTWTHELAPVAGGTRLTITERGTVKNPVFRFLGRFVFGYAATIEDFLKALGAELGQPVVFEAR